VLVGDWAQLSSVEAGGAFHMLVRDRELAPELSDVRRFAQPWEKSASAGLRIGDIDAVDSYEEHGRVTGGDRESMLDVLYEGWRDHTDAGKRSLMIANDNDTVTALNQRARQDRVATGEVTERGVATADGSVVGVGDVVVTSDGADLCVPAERWRRGYVDDAETHIFADAPETSYGRRVGPGASV